MALFAGRALVDGPAGRIEGGRLLLDSSGAESINVAGVPPPTGTTLSEGEPPVAVSGTMNPRRDPSGEKNGLRAPSPPATGVA